MHRYTSGILNYKHVNLTPFLHHNQQLTHHTKLQDIMNVGRRAPVCVANTLGKAWGKEGVGAILTVPWRGRRGSCPRTRPATPRCCHASVWPKQQHAHCIRDWMNCIVSCNCSSSCMNSTISRVNSTISRMDSTISRINLAISPMDLLNRPLKTLSS